MKQSKKLNHIPIYDAETGLKAGYMAGLQYGNFTRTEGLFFIDNQGSWRQLDFDQVELFGEDAIFLKSGFQAKILTKQPQKVRDKQRALIPVLTSEGVSPGRVSDIILQEQHIIGVEISDGILKDILRGRGFLLYRDIAKWGQDMILVKPDAIMYRPQLSMANRLGRITYVLLLLGLAIPLLSLIRPLLYALLIAYGLYPLNLFFKRKGCSDALSALTAVTVLLIGLISFILLLFPLLDRELQAMLQTLPDFFARYNHWLEAIPEYSHNFGFVTNTRQWQQMLLHGQNIFLAKLESYISNFYGSLSGIFDFFLAPILAYYILKDWSGIRDSILAVFSVKMQGDLVYTGSEIHKVIQSFLKGNLLTSIIVGFMTYAGLRLINLDFPGLLAILAGFGNLIPYFGAIISSIPVFLMGWLHSPLKALVAVLIVVMIQQIESNILTPKILSHSLGLSPMVIILALIIGGEYFGILGMFLAAPAAAILQILGRSILAKLV